MADRHGDRTATDVDLLAVRLPHAAELVPGRRAHPRDLLLGQDPLLATDPNRTEILIAEVKRGRARINEGFHDVDVLRFALRRKASGAHREALREAVRHEAVLAGGRK